MSAQDIKITDKKGVGLRIKEVRKMMGLTQLEFGKLLNLTSKAISAYEVGRVTPTINTLRRLESISGKSLRYFIEGRIAISDIEGRLSKIEHDLTEVKIMISQLSRVDNSSE